MDDDYDENGDYIPYTITNGSIFWKSRYTFDDGSPRPKCINHGCYEPVVCSKGNKDSAPSERTLRTVCSHCHNVSYGKKDARGNPKKLRKGVTSFKKSICENADGHVTGNPCTATGLISGQLEMDHIDGNHIKNIPENVQTLCKNCHSLKGMQNGDFRKLCKSHSSSIRFDTQTTQNTFSLIFGSVHLSKTDPSSQNTIPCMVEID